MKIQHEQNIYRSYYKGKNYTGSTRMEVIQAVLLDYADKAMDIFKPKYWCSNCQNNDHCTTECENI